MNTKQGNGLGEGLADIQHLFFFYFHNKKVLNVMLLARLDLHN